MRIKKILKNLLMIIMIVSIISPTFYLGDVNAATISINKSKISIRENERYNLKITGSNNKVVWSSKDPSIAKVGKTGYVYGKTQGTTTVYAKVGNKKLSCSVTVKKAKINTPEKYFSFEKDSVNGIKVYWEAKNQTGKVVNYYTVNFRYINAVGDPAYDEITGLSTGSAKYVGPVGKNSTFLVFSEIGYVPLLSTLEITSIDLVYSDKTKETINYYAVTTKNELSFDY